MNTRPKIKPFLHKMMLKCQLSNVLKKGLVGRAIPRHSTITQPIVKMDTTFFLNTKLKAAKRKIYAIDFPFVVNF